MKTIKNKENIAIITDQHFGIKNDAQYMLDYQQKFYDEIFFPYLEKNKIDVVFNLGDLFDRRKYINYITLRRTKEMFLDRLRDMGIKMYIIPGNHDVYHKNTNEVNALTGLLQEYDNIKVFETPEIMEVNGTSFMFIPWINNENYTDILNYMQNNDADILCGHLEIAGFEMMAGIKNDHGMDRVVFSKFKEVWSGHFHHKSESGNIKYLGSPMEFTFADCNDPRGFHVYNTTKNQLTFHMNKFTMFEKIYYNDEDDKDTDKFRNCDTSVYEGKNVRVFVTHKAKPAVFEYFIDKLYNENLINLVVMEDYSEFHESSIDMEDLKEKSTKDLMDDYVESVETDMNKVKLKSLLNNIYIEAITQQNDNI